MRGYLFFVKLDWCAIVLIFQTTNQALSALWENRLIKYIYIFFCRGYVVLISAQPWTEIEEFSLKFKALDQFTSLVNEWEA